MDASTLTDPDCLGPCEPGTSVVLEGLVWAESNNGMYTQRLNQLLRVALSLAATLCIAIRPPV